MTRRTNSPDRGSTLFDLESDAHEQVALSGADLKQAARLSQSIINQTQQWQVYLNALALRGFQRWLQEQAPDLAVDTTRCTVGGTTVVTDLRVEALNVSLLVMGSVLDQTVPVPQSSLDGAQAGQVYVWVAVEEDMVRLYGVIRTDQLMASAQAGELHLDADRTYPVPSAWFDPRFGPSAVVLSLFGAPDQHPDP